MYSETEPKSLLSSGTVHLCDRYSFNSMTLVLVTTGSVRISRDAEVCTANDAGWKCSSSLQNYISFHVS